MDKAIRKRYEDLLLEIDILCYEHGFRKMNIEIQDIKTGEGIDAMVHPVDQTEERIIAKITTEKRRHNQRLYDKMRGMKIKYGKEINRLKEENERLRNAEEKRHKKEYLKCLEDNLIRDAKRATRVAEAGQF